MSALEILSQHRTPLSSMTDEALDLELEICSYELSYRNRWGDDTKVIEQDLVAIEDEIRCRRVAARRADTISTKPFVVDDPGVRQSQSAPEFISLVGTAKARAEWKPSRFLLIVATAVLTVLLISAGTMARDRLINLDDQYAARIV